MSALANASGRVATSLGTMVASEAEWTILLPPTVRLAEASDLCRNAVLEFFAGMRQGATKYFLAGWLEGPYRNATRWAIVERGSEPMPPLGEPISDETVRDIAERARLAASGLLVRLGASGRGCVATEGIAEKGLVVPAVDRWGASGYLPVRPSRASLSARLRSLLVADFFSRPELTIGCVSICDGCGQATFDGAPGLCCDAHETSRESGERPALDVSFDDDDVEPAPIELSRRRLSSVQA
jgi:hypothetical protein